MQSIRLAIAIGFLFCVGLVWVPAASAGGAGAAEETVVLPKSAYEAILNKLDALQRKVDQLEKNDKRVQNETSQLNRNIDDIYDTLDEVETKTIKDRLNLGVELRSRVDNWRVKDAPTFTPAGLPTEQDYNADNHWTTRFRLNMNAEIMKNLHFNGRLAVYKNWANNEHPSYYPYADSNSVHNPSDTSLKLDRAYVDWILPDLPLPVAITFGRQPSSEGPASEFKENRLRQSTYPVLLFDGEADGIVATVGLERVIGLPNSGLRFAYGKGYQSQDDQTLYLDSRSGIDDLNVFGFFFETEIPNLPDSLFILSYVRGNNFVDNPGGPNDNLGDMDLFGIHAQASKLLGSNFDLFLSLGMNQSHPNKSTVAVPIIDQYGNVISRTNAGLLSWDGKDRHTGWAVYTGFRYTLPYAKLNNPKFGFEYNHGSRYWLSFTQGTIELYNKLATRGDVFDFYYIQPFNKFLFLRAGFTYVDYDYTGSGSHLGRPEDTDMTLQNFYLLLDCRF